MDNLSAIANFLLFLPFFFGLFLLGSLKGIIVCPVALMILGAGDTVVILGLWPAHIAWTYYSIARTKRFGIVLKLVSLLFLPVPLVLWPVIGIAGSLLVGLGYGFFTPLVATFEAIREGREQKFFHCFLDGVWDTVRGSCTVVRDFTDFCYHSYLSYLNDFRIEIPKDHQPYDIKVLELPGCFLVAVLGVLVDVPLITLVAIAKSPVMLVKGWRRLLHDLIGWEGPFLETVCVPFAGLAILLWPLVVIAAVVSAFLSSMLIGLYGAVVVYQESSFQCGLAYIVAMVAEFDEYSNDVIYVREGSCLPRPRYRRQRSQSELSTQPQKIGEKWKLDIEGLPSPAPTPRSGSLTSRAGSEVDSLSIRRSRSLRQTLQEVTMVQIMDNIFKTCELYGKELIQAGAIKLQDLEEWSRSSKSSKSRIVGVGLPAYSLLCNLIRSAMAGSSGLLLFDGIEVNRFNRPQERMLDWFFEPLLLLKEQIKALGLKETEELYFKKWVLYSGESARIEEWQNGGVLPETDLRNGELHALSRRLQGIARSISRIPTFRRRFQCTIRTLMAFSLECSKGIGNSSEKDSCTTFNTWPEQFESKAARAIGPVPEVALCKGSGAAISQKDSSMLDGDNAV
eukprot:c24132_g1_i1 orf=285-2150(+)